jgi:lipopolysaccharide/colanic/teichoic acid biosynthesis glycosyltransferase
MVKIKFTKRLFDIALSLILIIILLPFILLIVLLRGLENLLLYGSLSPIFFIDPRFSAGKKFGLIKFNIFKKNVIENEIRSGKVIHTKNIEQNHASLTRIGIILKNVYLDELPQLFNILAGSMSFVGPRPVNEEVYASKIKNGNLVNEEILGGLTGIYQSQKGKLTKGQLTLDREYVEYCRNNPGYKIVIKDIRIILDTIKIVLEAKGI